MVVLASFYRRVSSRLTENGGSSFSLLTDVLALVDARPEDRYRVGLFPGEVYELGSVGEAACDWGEMNHNSFFSGK